MVVLVPSTWFHPFLEMSITPEHEIIIVETEEQRQECYNVVNKKKIIYHTNNK